MSDAEARDRAFTLAEQHTRGGRPAYCRFWHLGETGVFVVAYDDYSRLETVRLDIPSVAAVSAEEAGECFGMG